MSFNYKDLFHLIKAPAVQLTETTLTASKTDLPVIDLTAEKPGTKVGWLVWVKTTTTADATNTFAFLPFEASAKTSSTALTAGTAAAAADVEGLTLDGNFLTTTSTPATSTPWPVINSTSGQTGVFWFAYNGSKPYVQLQPTETGTASIACTILAVLYSGDIVNTKAEIVL